MANLSTKSFYQAPAAFWCLMLVCALLRFYIVQLDLNILLDQGLLQDDAFYYYEIGKYFLSTGTPSFDGINPTNGFHPLWQAICLIPLFFLQGAASLPWILSIAVIFDLFSLYLIFILLRYITQRTLPAWCGAAIWGLHGTIIRTWFNGLETSLHIFSLLLLLWFYVRYRDTVYLTLRHHIILGALAAFAFLARTDSAVIVIVMFSFIYLPPLLKRKIFDAVVVSTFCLFLISPWLLWNLIHFGNIVQISGQVKNGAWLSGGAPPDLPFWSDVFFGVLAIFTPVQVVFEKMFLPNNFKLLISGYLFLAGLCVSVFYLITKNNEFKKNFKQVFPFFLGVAVLFIYHSAVRHFVRGWYNAPVLLCFTLVLGLLLSHLFSLMKKRSTYTLTFILILLLLSCFSPFFYTQNKQHPDPRIAAAKWINQHTPLDAKIGAANAGIVGYFANRPVINLDGVVNEKAFHARMANELQRYIFESRISYFADHKGALNHLCAENVFYQCKLVFNAGQSTQVIQVIPKK